MVQAENSKCKAPEVGTRNSIGELEEQKEAPGGCRAASQRGRAWGRLGRLELPAACSACPGGPGAVETTGMLESDVLSSNSKLCDLRHAT